MGFETGQNRLDLAATEEIIPFSTTYLYHVCRNVNYLFFRGKFINERRKKKSCAGSQEWSWKGGWGRFRDSLFSCISEAWGVRCNTILPYERLGDNSDDNTNKTPKKEDHISGGKTKDRKGIVATSFMELVEKGKEYFLSYLSLIPLNSAKQKFQNEETGDDLTLVLNPIGHKGGLLWPRTFVTAYYIILT